MKKLIFLLVFAFIVVWGVNTQVNPKSTRVSGYTKKNGTYVPAYVRTKANTTIKDNYSTKPNVNPYTGKVGTVTKKK